MLRPRLILGESRFGLLRGWTSPLSLMFKRNNSQFPKSSDGRRLDTNDWRARVPKFPLGKETLPTLIPKLDTPRVSDKLNFRQLVMKLKQSTEPELLYMAESHRLYFLSSIALTFIVCYNLFDLLDRSIRSLIDEYRENPEDLGEHENRIKTIKRGSLVALMAGVYATAAYAFASIPTRLIRRIEYLPGAKEHLRLVTHPWLPGRPSPVYTIPLENLSIGKRSKVWTGAGFYGTAHRSQFLFFLFEKGKWGPYVVDRNGWFWGDGRVYDVLLGKEPIELAEKGLSHDDILRIRQNEASKKKVELRRQLGPAWRVKAMGRLMKEDADKVRNATKRALQSSVEKGPKQVGGSKESKRISAKAGNEPADP